MMGRSVFWVLAVACVLGGPAIAIADVPTAKSDAASSAPASSRGRDLPESDRPGRDLPEVDAVGGAEPNDSLAVQILASPDFALSRDVPPDQLNLETRVFSERLILSGYPLDAAYVVDVGWTPLFSAVLAANRPEGRALLDQILAQGATADFASGEGLTALILAGLLGRTAAARSLVEAGADAAQIRFVAAELLPRADLDVGDVAGTEAETSPLHLAAARGDEEMVVLLLEAGATLEQSVDGGMTALISAARGGYYGLVETLLERGARPNQASLDGTTAVLESVEEGHRDVLKLLLDHGAKPEPRNRDGETPLMRAVEKNDTRAAELLVDHGADVHQVLHSGDFLLHMAAWNGHTSVAEFLIRRGVNVQQRSSQGETALDIALSENRVVTAAMLRRHATVSQ